LLPFDGSTQNRGEVGSGVVGGVHFILPSDVGGDLVKLAGGTIDPISSLPFSPFNSGRVEVKCSWHWIAPAATFPKNIR